MTNALRPRNRKRERATAARKAMDKRQDDDGRRDRSALLRMAVQKKSRSNTLR